MATKVLSKERLVLTEDWLGEYLPLVLVLPLTSCVTLDRSLPSSVPHLQCGKGV